MAKQRTCRFCGRDLPADAAPARRYCDDDCKRGVVKPSDDMGPVAAATEESIDAATHLTKMDLGALQALRVLARKLDQLADERVESLDDLKAKFDNVTIPTYLKFCESLGLTPAGRLRYDKPKEGTSGGKLAQLRSIAGGKTAT